MASVDFQAGALATLPAGTKVSVEVIGGENVERVVPVFGASGVGTKPSNLTPFPIGVFDAAGNQITNFGGTAGLVSGYHRTTTADTNPVVIATGNRKLRAVRVFNVADYPIYVKFHDTSSAPTAGVSVVRAYGFQAGTERDVPISGGGLAFGSGLSMTVVKGLADSDATAVALNDALIEVEYE